MIKSPSQTLDPAAKPLNISQREKSTDLALHSCMKVPPLMPALAFLQTYRQTLITIWLVSPQRGHKPNPERVLPNTSRKEQAFSGLHGLSKL